MIRSGARAVTAREKWSWRGTVAMACGTVLLAHVTRPWQVYAAFAVMSAGWATMSGAAINIIVAPWFDKRRGLAVSWALNGASAGGIIIAPLLTVLTARFGFARLPLGVGQAVARSGSVGTLSLGGEDSDTGGHF